MIKLKVLLIILFAELWGVGGQILYKKSVTRIGTPDLRSLSSYIEFFKKIIAMPGIWIGFGCVTIGISIWLAALAQADLSIAFPIDSMQYIMTLVAAHIFLGEKINKMKLTGTLLVVGGIILVVLS